MCVVKNNRQYKRKPPKGSGINYGEVQTPKDRQHIDQSYKNQDTEIQNENKEMGQHMEDIPDTIPVEE